MISAGEPAIDGPAVDRRGVSGVGAHGPGESALHVRRAARRVGHAGQPLRAEAAARRRTAESTRSRRASGRSSRRSRRSSPRSGACCTPGTVSAARRPMDGGPSWDRSPIHVMLDYSNLSFISAQSPYVALLRDPRQQSARGHATRSRRVHRLRLEPAAALHVGTIRLAARPKTCSSACSRRASRSGPRCQRADTEYEVYFLNDRGAIYALGYPRPSGVRPSDQPRGAAWRSAAVTYLLLLAAGLVYGADRRAHADVGPRAAARGARELLPQAVHRVRRRRRRAGARAGARHPRLHRRR